MKTPAIIVAAICGAFILLGSIYVSASERLLLKSVQSGEAELTCLFSDGKRVVPGKMVTGITDTGWKFKNGHASSCEVKFL